MIARSLHVFCDFDGTVTAGDTVDRILEEVADRKWRHVESLWQRGKISSQECMYKQIALIQGGWPAIEKVLTSVTLDSGFNRLVEWCRAGDLPFTIVSDGLDRVIHWLLDREGVRVGQVFANRLIDTVSGDLKLEFPERGNRIVCPSGYCKCQILDQTAANTIRVVIGDGQSDFCWAHQADLLFAKDKLLTYCETQGLDYRPYSSLDDVLACLKAMVEERSEQAVA